MNYNKIDALFSLKPNKDFIWRGTDYSGLEWLDSSTKPTESELDAEVTRLTNAEPMRLLRIERDQRLASCDWRVVMAKETGSNIPAAWKTYRQALRDLPASASPKLDSNGNLILTSVTWPTEPS
tara:strand:+ start:194 stop:565 length:372 start_codon:yes stop_codon:yes gene_type:complete